MVKWRYGEIVAASGGAYSSKPRPVLILQNPLFETGSSVIVAPFTSMRKDEITTRLAVSPSEANGLDRACYIEVDKMSAVKASAIGPVIGRLDDETLKEVTSMAVALVSPTT